MAMELDKWQKELSRLENTAYRECDNALFRAYRGALKGIKADLKDYIDRYDTLTFSQRLEADRLFGVAGGISREMQKLFGAAGDAITAHSTASASIGYNGAWYALEGRDDLLLSMSGLDPAYVENLIGAPVAGSTLSQRLYLMRDKLATNATNAILQGFFRGDGYADIAKQINLTTEASYRQALRIARTEGHRIRTQTTLDAYAEARSYGLDVRAVWMATLDLKTRPEHGHMDGQRADDSGYFHSGNGYATRGPGLFGIASEDCNCRCTLISGVDGDMPELRRDNETGEITEYQTYDEWQKIKQAQADSDAVSEYDVELKGIGGIQNEAVRLGRMEKRELLYFVDSNNGKIVFKPERGSSNEVVIPRSTMKYLKNAGSNSIILIHNHPRSSSFSPEDIDVLCSYKSLKEIQAIGHDGTKYYLSVGKGQRIKYKEINDWYDSQWNQLFDKYSDKIISRELTEDEAWKEHSHEIVTIMSRWFGWIYRRAT